jgi:hypothetical protein
VLTHTFRVKNSSAEARTIQKDTDVQPNCGCAAIVPEARTLQSGAETDVKVTIRTGGLLRKQGPFAHGGKIVWTEAGGRRHATSLTIRGQALSPLASSPETLMFQPDEVKRGAIKEVMFTANAPIDWNTWTLTSSSPYFEIVERTPPGDQGRASCKVKCLPPDCLENFHGEIRVKAQARPSGREASPSLPVAFAIQVRARQTVDLTISPQVLPLTFGRPPDRATVRLTFRGEQVAKDQIQIEAIDYPGCTATWKLTKKAEATIAVLEVTLLRQPAKSAEAAKEPPDPDPKMLIRLAGKRPIALPVVEVGPSLDRP